MAAGAVDSEEDDDPAPQLSPIRVAIALVLVLAIIGGGGYALKNAVAGTTTPELSPTWFAPYVDTTLTPTYQFQVPANNPARQIVLGFVVADPKHPCDPSWGGYYTLQQAATALNLDRRIAQVRANGGTPIASFGGESQTELALSCQDATSLQAAYASVISRYSLSTVDFDIEGPALNDQTSVQRRADALAALQHKIRDTGHHLAIWLTLPVEPNGLQANALSVVTTMLHAGVDLAGINVMTMDFSQPVKHMSEAVGEALSATHDQLVEAYRSYGVSLNSDQLWNKVGATVMIGQNNTAGDVYTVADAAQLVVFARDHHLGRISLWSLNRDRQCGSQFPELNVLSNICSGTAQQNLEFSATFAKLAGTAAEVSEATTPPAVIPNPIDNPATSPYPIWQPGSSYPAGYKVVREGYVYQAKWYNQGDDPAAQTPNSYATPWLLIGPVLPGDHAPTTTTLPGGRYPTWNPKTTYTAGDRVLRNGLPYRAKWYNQGQDPLAASQGSSDSPWAPEYTIPGEPSQS